MCARSLGVPPPTLTGVEMHEVLRGLVEQLGPEVFDDPDNFRGALDDVLDEEASLGEQNLVVDAVRLGAYASMVTMLRQGGDPTSTVAQAGAMLARDRGGDDRTSASWACACLAYAVGAVEEAQVLGYRTAQAAPPPEPTRQRRASAAAVLRAGAGSRAGAPARARTDTAAWAAARADPRRGGGAPGGRCGGGRRLAAAG